MNRTTVLILALVLLLAHVLAMHHDSSGSFALPSDLAHVDFRIARNAIHGQGTSWSAGQSAAAIAEEGGTSFLWIALAAAAEFFALSPVRVSAFAGILAALLTLAVVARLNRDRLVGVTATVLLVVSGSFAAAAADGTATVLLTFFLALAFLALERRRVGFLGLALALAVLTRSDAMVYALGFLAAALLGQRTPSRKLRLAPAFLPPLAAAALIIGIRMAHGARPLPPLVTSVFAFDPTQIHVGLWSVEAFVRGSLAPLLILLPTLQFLTGRLSGTGRRALGIAALGLAIVVLSGAHEAPMHVAFVPLLPMVFIAVQEGFISGLDRHPEREWMAWSCLSIACLCSTLASKIPGDLGPLPTEGLLNSMARENPVRQAAFGHEWNGRPGLTRDLNTSARLRALGIFFRSHTAPDATILTPWPGAISYLSGRRVTDLFDRAATSDGAPTASWMGRHRADVVAALEALPDYVVPVIADRKRPPSQAELVGTWLRQFDTIGLTPEREAQMAQALQPYDLIAVPTPRSEDNLDEPSDSPAFLLRLRSLGLAPRLTCELHAGHLNVRVKHPGRHQIVELEVAAIAPDGTTWYLAPTGEFRPTTPLRARTEMLLFPTGDRHIELIGTSLPENLEGATITARLLNPYSNSTDPLAAVGASVTIP